MEQGTVSHCRKTDNGYECSFDWADEESAQSGVQEALDDLVARVEAGEISQQEAEIIADQILRDDC